MDAAPCWAIAAGTSGEAAGLRCFAAFCFILFDFRYGRIVDREVPQVALASEFDALSIGSCEGVMLICDPVSRHPSREIAMAQPDPSSSWPPLVASSTFPSLRLRRWLGWRSWLALGFGEFGLQLADPFAVLARSVMSAFLLSLLGGVGGVGCSGLDVLLAGGRDLSEVGLSQFDGGVNQLQREALAAGDGGA
mmetsp:Transcript_4659/g.9293  ORF Transcript_4659/g.9293 Transcript_4659/m.9293 type:complete len:193 (+) Transcript_4659:373-951(+)